MSDAKRHIPTGYGQWEEHQHGNFYLWEDYNDLFRENGLLREWIKQHADARQFCDGPCELCDVARKALK